jgi:phage-related minor tail protein
MATVLGINIKVGFDDKGLKEANKKIGKFLKTGLKAGGVAAGAALGAVGAAAAVAAAETINFAEDANAAMEQFRRQTGETEESMVDFTASAKDLFATGIGEGIDDIADAMATVSNTMKTGAKETEGLTKRALTMRKVFDKDVSESIDGVKVLMDEFGLTSDQAFDFMTEGIQKGLDRNGDFLDSIREYGNLFSEGGATAGEFFSVLESGAAGGVLGTDKAADAFKEFQIRFIEGDKDLKQAFTNLGLDFDFFKDAVDSGAIPIIDVFRNVAGEIGRADTSLISTKQTTALLGTQFEDLGAEAVAGISTGTTSLEDMSGAMDNIIAKNMTIGESMDTLRRQMVVALEPAAQELMPLLADGVAKVSEFLMEARPIFTDFAGDLSNTLGPAISIIGDSLSRIAAVFGVVDENASGMDTALAILKGTLDLVVTGIEAVAVASKLLADAFEIAKELAQQIGQIGSLIGEGLGFGDSGGGGLLGFQDGGGFTVGGAGGSDSQLVAFNATPGERVEITTPSQAITIDGETFAVRQAERMAAAINGVMQRNAQMIVDVVAANL